MNPGQPASATSVGANWMPLVGRQKDKAAYGRTPALALRGEGILRLACGTLSIF
jgi:hypothetical protein